MAGKDTITSSIFVEVKYFLRSGRFKNIQVLDDELIFLRPTDSEASLPLNRVTTLATDTLHDLWIEQVKDFLIVYLKEAHKHAIMSSGLHCFHLFDTLEELMNASLRYTNVIRVPARRYSLPLGISALHCEGLTGTCLSVGENRPMVTLEASRVINNNKNDERGRHIFYGKDTYVNDSIY